MGLGVCIADQFPGEADTAHHKATHWEPMISDHVSNTIFVALVFHEMLIGTFFFSVKQRIALLIQTMNTYTQTITH